MDLASVLPMAQIVVDTECTFEQERVHVTVICFIMLICSVAIAEG